MSRIKNLIFSLAVFVSFSCATQALAVPNFNSGFTDWSGQLSDGVDVIAADLTSDPHFSYSGNIATISYSDIFDPYWTQTLSQTSSVDSLYGAGYQLYMSFYMQMIVGDGGTFGGHIVSATLGADALLNTTDLAIQSRLLAGDTFTVDITSYAGTSSLLAFTLSDLDWSVTDSLRIGDFAFSQVAPPPIDPPNAPVPEPSTMLLLGAGLAGLVMYRKRAKA